MVSVQLDKTLGRALQLASTAITWWLDELAQMLPAQWRRRLRPVAPEYFLDVDGSEIVLGLCDGDGYRELSRGQDIAKLDPDRPVIVRLPRRQAFERRITLPAAVERDLRGSLELQLDRHIPLKVSEVSFDARVVSRDTKAGRLVVELAIVEKAVVDHALGTAERLGLQVASVILANGAETKQAYRFFTAAKDWKLPIPNLATIAPPMLVAVMLALAVISAGRKYDRAIDYLQTEIDTATADGRDIDRLKQEVSDLEAKLVLLEGQRRTGALLAPLNDLSKAIPDGSWLQELQMRDGAIRIQGYSPNASALVGPIEASALFENVRFSAPVTRSPAGDGLERFDLSFTTVRENGQ